MTVLGAEDPDSLTSGSGGGVDTVSYAGSGNGAIVTLAGGIGAGDPVGVVGGGAGLFSGDGADIGYLGGHPPVTLQGDTGAGSVIEGGGVDTGSFGSQPPVTLQGGAGAGDPGSVLVGGGLGDPGSGLFGGNDPSLGGSAVADTLLGGADTFTSTLANATINLAKGYVSATGGTVQQIHAIENVIASGNHIHVIGTADANIIDASHASGDNVLDGGAGDDTLIGGTADGTINRFFGGAGADHFESAATGHAVYDYLDYDSSPAAVSINLQAGLFFGGDAAGDSISFGGGSVVTGVIGSAFGDTIRAGDPSDISLATKMDSLIYGGDGNDTLIFGSGRDWMSGGAGADTFVYDTLGGFRGDVIRDFSSAQGDRIDLSAIDADGDAGNGRTAFHFVGQTADPGHGEVGFTAAAGGIQETFNAGETMIVYLAGVTAVTAHDFHL
jgi:Ca2+-binding RTX toxin-like protein